MTDFIAMTICLCMLAAPLAADDVKQGAPPIEPIVRYCTDKTGARHELGAVICIVASSCQIWLGKCDMSLNNTMWRKIQDGCPAALSIQTPAMSLPATG